MILSAKERAVALAVLGLHGIEGSDAESSLRVIAASSEDVPLREWRASIAGMSEAELRDAYGTDAVRAALALREPGAELHAVAPWSEAEEARDADFRAWSPPEGGALPSPRQAFEAGWERGFLAMYRPRVVLPAMSEAELEDAIRNARPGPLQLLPTPPAPALSPVQLRQAAERIRLRRPPPSVAMPPGEYVAALGLHALADALDGLAEAEVRLRVQEAEADL